MEFRRLGGLAALVLAAGAGGAARSDEPPKPIVVADFEKGGKAPALETTGSEAAAVADPGGGKGTVARWTVRAGAAPATLTLKGVPEDLRPFRTLRFRARREGNSPGMAAVRIGCGERASLSIRLPALGAEWRSFAIPLERMSLRGAFDPRKAYTVGFRVERPRDGVILVDDLAFEGEVPPTDAGKARAADSKWTIDDFEAPGAADRVDTVGGSVEATAEKDAGQVLRWTPDGPGETSLALLDLPGDLSPYRALHLRLRAEKEGAGPLEVGFRDGPSRALTWEIRKVGKKWEDVEIQLPRMRPQGDLDPRRVEELLLVQPKAGGALFLDDVWLEQAPGGWEPTDREIAEIVFGKGKAAKVVHKTTPHFAIHTDSSAAAAKLPEMLEDAYAFAKQTLGLPEFDRPLTTCVFQNTADMADYFERERGVPKKVATMVPGLGTARRLVLSFRGPEDFLVTREVAASWICRARGAGGGCWLRIGASHYVRKLKEKEDPATEWAPRLKGGKFLPLAQLLAIPDLLLHDDPKGGTGNNWVVILEAAAFYEFLRIGPMHEAWAEAEGIVARMDLEPAEVPAAVAEALSMNIATLEAAWVDAGSRAGKGR